jgi:hypothetical protein
MLTTPKSLQYTDFLSFVSTKQYTKKVGTMMFPQIAKLNFISEPIQNKFSVSSKELEAVDLKI